MIEASVPSKLSAPVRYRINSPKVIHQIFDTEVVIVNLESGNYYSVGGSGIDIWRFLDAGKSRDEITKVFAANPENTAKMESFLDEIEREQLVVAAPDNSAAREVAAPKSFVAPTIEKFTDMRDLLLLDPIHELDESGWPKNLPPVSDQK